MTTQERNELIDKIRRLPQQIADLVTGLSDEQLTTQYLVDEWTVAQNVHHLVDSHMNSYIRCKLIATEEHPTLKPYDQDAWAQFADASAADVSGSLFMLAQLHRRWVSFWETLSADEWGRTGHHPESGTVTLETQLAFARYGQLAKVHRCFQVMCLVKHPHRKTRSFRRLALPYPYKQAPPTRHLAAFRGPQNPMGQRCPSMPRDAPYWS